MVFKKFQSSNNADSTLQAGISASDLSIIVKAGEGDLFPSHNGTTDKDYLVTLRKYNASLFYTKQEIVLVTKRVGDVLTIVRVSGVCVQDQTADPKVLGNTAKSFDVADSVSLYVVAEDNQDVKNEITRLETDKANDDEVVHLTGNQVIGGIKTYLAFPVTPSSAPTTDYQVTNKKYVDDSISAMSGVATLTNSDYLCGEDIIQGDSLFVENMISFPDGDTVNAHNISFTANGTQTGAIGYRFEALTDIVVKSVVRGEGVPPVTRAILKNDAGTTLQAVSFWGNIATFTASNSFTKGTYFRVECDNNGSGYNASTTNIVTFPIIRNDVAFLTGSSNGSNSTQASNPVMSITTNICLSLGDLTKNTRIACRAIGSGVSGSTLKLALKKVSSPSSNLNIRIETDNAGSPSGTLIDANATATIAPGSLTTDLVDTTLTLAGTITIPKGTICHIVIFVGTYGSETINSVNYYGVGYSGNNTTTRFRGLRNGTTRNYGTLLTGSVVTDAHGISFDNYGNTTEKRGFKIQTKKSLKIISIQKYSGSTATVGYILNSSQVVLYSANFVGNIATFPDNMFLTYRTELYICVDKGGASFTSYYSGAGQSRPMEKTNINYTTYLNQQADVVDVDTQEIDTTLLTGFPYISSSIFEDALLSKTDADYTYKLPNIPRISIDAHSTGELTKYDFKGITTALNGLTKDSIYYISNTPGALSTSAGTNSKAIGKALSTTGLYLYDLLSPNL